MKHAISEAFLLDDQVIIEQAVSNLWELEVGVIGSGEDNSVQLSCIGKFTTEKQFNDFESKYEKTHGLSMEIPAVLDVELADQIRSTAIEAYTYFRCRDFARVDFLYDTSTKQLYLNEINTIPGMTARSHFPLLWEKKGWSLAEVFSQLMLKATTRRESLGSTILPDNA